MSEAQDTCADAQSAAWRGELAQRLATYRARKRKHPADDGQTQLPFESPASAPPLEPRTPAVAVAEAPGVVAPSVTPTADSLEPEFSFTIAIGRTANARSADEGQMFIDVSLPPATESESEAHGAGSEPGARQHAGMYPVASMEDRRVAGAIDAFCLLFICGGFVTLFGSLGAHFSLNKLNAAVYAATFGIVYLQYFSLFTVFGGTTPGMMLRGLRVVDFSGEDPSPRQFLLRAAGYILSAGTFFLGFLWSQWDEDELTWHDRISRTYLCAQDTLGESELSGVTHSH